MLRYIDNMIFPNVNESEKNSRLIKSARKRLPYSTVMSLIERTLYRKKLKSHNVQPVFFPDVCTNKIQPLDYNGSQLRLQRNIKKGVSRMVFHQNSEDTER